MATAGGADAESYAVELALPSFSAFYEQHNPKHGRLAKRLLQMHAGNEEKLFDGLVTKYGDAAVTDLVTGISQAAEKAAGARLPSPSGTKDTVASRSWVACIAPGHARVWAVCIVVSPLHLSRA